MKKLTAKQALFVKEYLIDLNATQAAKRAGYSKRTAGKMGAENLAKPVIAIALCKAQGIRSEKLEIGAEWVLKRASLLADFNIRRFIRVDESGNAIYDFTQATDDDWYCISEYTVDCINKGYGEDKYEVERVKLKGFDKLKALELVGKHISVQAFKESIEHTGKDGAPIEVVQLDPEQYAKTRADMLNDDDC